MQILIYCLLIAALLPFLSKIPLAYQMHKLGGYDNKQPRAQQARLTGSGARALAAHQNAFESLIIFSGAIAVALATGHTGDLIQNLAMTHVIARVAYHICYLANWHIVRSTVWFVGLLSALTIIYLCLP